jgi:hypothetical protein
MSLDRNHAPFQALAVATVAVGLLAVPFSLSVRDPVALAGAYFAWTVAVYLWAAGGTLVAATGFERGAPLRPGWMLLSASYAVLVPGRLLAGPTPTGLHEGAPNFGALLPLFSLASGLLGVAGFVLLAHAWRASGLDLTSRTSRIALRVLALLVACALAGPDLLARLPAAAGGDPMAIVDVITDVLDGALFVVAVPVLRAALALGGGLVAWPWALLTLSLTAWLGFDAASSWGELAGLSPRAMRVAEEAMRGLGASAAFGAGVAQRWIMRPAPSLRRHDEPSTPA